MVVHVVLICEGGAVQTCCLYHCLIKSLTAGGELPHGSALLVTLQHFHRHRRRRRRQHYGHRHSHPHHCHH